MGEVRSREELGAMEDIGALSNARAELADFLQNSRADTDASGTPRQRIWQIWDQMREFARELDPLALPAEYRLETTAVVPRAAPVAEVTEVTVSAAASSGGS